MANDEYEVLDDDLLEETDLVLEDDEAEDFEEEPTGIYQPGVHDLEDDGGFEEEATRVYDPSEDDDAGFEDDATRVWQSPADEPPAPARPVAAAATPAARPQARGPFTTQLPQSGVVNVAKPGPDTFDEERTVITDSASVYGSAAPARRPSQPQVALPQNVSRQPAKRSSPWLPALALLLIGGLAAAAILFFGGRPSPEVAATGTVALFTSPSGATVTVDGQRYPNTTPTTLSDLSVDAPHIVVLELDGYQPVEDTLIVTTAGLQQKEYAFQPTAGSVSIRTVPEGAQITVAGVSHGVSPVTVPNLDASASHEIVATLEGYEPATRTVNFTANGPREQLVSLALTAVPVPEGSGEGSGEGEPSAAELAAIAAAEEEAAQQARARREASRTPSRSNDNEERSRSSSRSNDEDEDEDERRSRRRPSGDDEEEATPSRRPSERPSRSRTRPSRETEPQGFGTLSVQAVPFGQVWVDGRVVTEETPLISHRLSAGSHRVKVYFVNLRQFSDERTVRIDPDANRTVTFRAER